MRDLRNGNIVKNVTRSSARKLWHYAITEREANPIHSEQVQWVGISGCGSATSVAASSATICPA